MPEQLLLKILTGPRAGYSLPLNDKKEILIGRKKGHIILEDPLISSQHARLFLQKNVWYIQDLGSTNGTFLMGQRIKEEPLPPDTDLSIGGSTLRITTNQQPIASNTNIQPLESAWLLDEERVRELPQERSEQDEIDNALRLPPSLQAVLEVISGDDQGKIFRCQTGNINIGRKIGEIPLTDKEVSRRHAIIEFFGREMIFFRDLGSTNGSIHNGEKIKTTILQNGDSIEVGKTVMRFKIL
jgi:pSer/pThr/pTyr-binding forkhead associated (FHA) protein